MKKILLFFLLAFFVTSMAFASQELIINPYEISISGNVGTFGDVTVKIETNRKKEDLKIVSIKLQINGEWKSVPEPAFSDLKEPLLNETQIRTEAGYDGSPWLYIYFETAHRDENNKWNPQIVHIAYHKGKFESRSITIPTADGKSKWVEKKL